MTHPSTRRRPQGPTGSTRRIAGFTLIELLIAVAVIGILASIAIPNYMRYVKDSRVSDGKAKLLEVAGRLERCYTVTSDYTKGPSGAECVNFSNLKSDSEFYMIVPYEASGAINVSSYKIKAEGSSQEVSCTELWVDQTGQKGSVPDGCW